MATSIRASQQPCPLLDKTPPELRNSIYRLVLTTDGDVIIGSKSARHRAAVLDTCSQIRKEASGIFFAENTFRVLFSDKRSLPPAQINSREEKPELKVLRSEATKFDAGATENSFNKMLGVIRTTIRCSRLRTTQRQDVISHVSLRASHGLSGLELQASYLGPGYWSYGATWFGDEVPYDIALAMECQSDINVALFRREEGRLDAIYDRHVLEMWKVCRGRNKIDA